MTSIYSFKLTLVVVETLHMTQGEEFEINQLGLKVSKRKMNDGCVYAGSEEYQGKIPINDIILPSNESGIGKNTS